MRDGTLIQVENPAKLPETQKVEEIREPIITAKIFVPQEYLGAVITLCESKRGSQVNLAYHGRQVQLTYEMPMGEVVMDFFDKLKSVRAVMPRSITTSRSTGRPMWSSSTS